MKPRQGLLWAAVLALAALFGTAPLPAAPETPGTPPLNVLFIAADDLRPELGCYGKVHIHSPNMDRLASRGVVFNRAYCQYSVCNPSRSSLLTGLRPDSTGVMDNRTHFRKKAPEVVALPQQFKQHGYVTQAFGKIYHGAFETAYVGRKCDDEPSWSKPHWYGSPQYYFSPQGIEIARQQYAKKYKKPHADPDDWKTEFVQGLATEAPDVPDSTLYDGEMTDRAIKALGELKGKPFFLAVGYLKPHLPFVAPKKYWDLYDGAKIEMPRPATAPKGAPAVALHASGELRGQYTNMRDDPLSEAQMRELRHGYYACVSFVDAQIGRLLAELDRLGLREQTIVILWGDHGWHLGELSLWGKSTNFELDSRAPLIVSAPGRKAAGAKCNALVEFVDIFPSLCELAALPLPAHLEGASFAPLLDTPDKPWKSAAFSQILRGQNLGRTMRTDRYRFTRWHPLNKPEQTVALELYNLQNNPIEIENIAGRPENAALVKELSAKLEAGWRAAKPPGVE